MNRVTLLVADDEPIGRAFVQRYVQENNLPVSRVLTAANGQEAVDTALEFSPDLILMDIRMPVMNGLDAAAAILNRDPETCIVMVSAYDEFEYVRSALRMGVTDYLLKPLDPVDFTEKVHLALKAKGTRVVEMKEQQAKDAHPLVAQIRSYVGGNLAGNLHLLDIAKVVHMSPSHCSRMFSKFAGVSISDFVAQCRMDKARESLEKTYMSVTDIAESLGFSSSTYFANWFKRVTGLSPLQYRKKNKR